MPTGGGVPGGERRVVIGIGANLGDRLATIEVATDRIAALEGVALVRRSRIVETDPVGGPPQDRYFNGALLIRTALAPRALLQALLGIERDLGRTRDGTRNAPRTLDLDVLWMEGERVDEADLVVPHPRLAERAFALVPLVEVAPDAGDAAGVVYAERAAELARSARLVDVAAAREA